MPAVGANAHPVIEINAVLRNGDGPPGVMPQSKREERGPIMGKGILLWLLGIPIPIIILLLIFWH